MAEFMLQILIYDETMNLYYFLLVGCLLAAQEAAYASLDPKTNPSEKMIFGKKLYKMDCFVINNHFDHEFSRETYLEL